MNTRILSDDFIDEAQVRFAHATTKELARYIEAATIDAMVARRAYAPPDGVFYAAGTMGRMSGRDTAYLADYLDRQLSGSSRFPLPVYVDSTLPKGTIVVCQGGREVHRIVGIGWAGE